MSYMCLTKTYEAPLCEGMTLQLLSLICTSRVVRSTSEQLDDFSELDSSDWVL